MWRAWRVFYVYICMYIFSKVGSPLNVLCKITQELTFENVSVHTRTHTHTYTHTRMHMHTHTYTHTHTHTQTYAPTQTHTHAHTQTYTHTRTHTHTHTHTVLRAWRICASRNSCPVHFLSECVYTSIHRFYMYVCACIHRVRFQELMPGLFPI